MKPFDHTDQFTKRGIPVFPLRPGTKKPAINAWPRNATTTAQIISSWRVSPARLNIGIPTGTASDLIVIDLDVKNGVNGLANWKALVAQHPPVPQTWEAETPSTGRHLYFRKPKDLTINSSAGTVLGPGIDVRGEGGYIVAPPSSLGAAGSYRWLVPPSACPVAPMPPWLVILLTIPPPPSSAFGGKTNPGSKRGRPLPTEYKGWRVKRIPQGYRDNAVHSHGSALRRYGCRREFIHQELNHLNENVCDPPLDPEDIERITRSCGKYRPETEFSTVTERARELLIRRLHDGPVRAERAYRLGLPHGISERMIKEAKKYFGDLIVARRISATGTGRGTGYWEWDLASNVQGDSIPICITVDV